MSNRRRRKRPARSERPVPRSSGAGTARRASGGRSSGARSSGTKTAGATAGAKRAQGKASAQASSRRTAATDLTPHPPLGVSLARGLAAVGGSLPLLVTCFLAALGLWLVYSGYGTLVAPSPAAMVLFESLPPLHSFLDLQLVLSGRDVNFALAASFLIGLILLRAALQSLWVGLILESLNGNRGWRSSWSPGLRLGLRGFRTMVGVESALMLLAVASIFVAPGVLGPALGQLALIAVLVGGIYFLALAPVIAVAERQTLRPTLRLAARAARIPGPGHTLLALSYMAVALLIRNLTPGADAAAATPSVTTWAFTLFVCFLHLGCLAAFCYRWLVVRQPILRLVDPARSTASPGPQP